MARVDSQRAGVPVAGVRHPGGPPDDDRDTDGPPGHHEHPVLPPHVVEREGLFVRLDDSLGGPLLVLHAPVGYGKTVLVGSWLAARPSLGDRARWVTLQEGRAEDQVRDLLGESGAQSGQPTHLVLDDFHHLLDPVLAEQLIRWTLEPSGPWLAVLTRSTPPIPLGLLASRGSLAEVDDHDLVFTASEYRRLLELRGHQPVDAEVEQDLARTAGWPAALRIVSDHHLHHLGPHRLDLVLGSYLESEVLSSLSRPDRVLLRDASVLPVLDGPGAAAVTGQPDALEQLSRLYRHGIPMSWPGPQQVVVSPLLRETLLGHLRISDPATSRALNRRAVHWLRATGRPLEAIQQLVSDGDVDEAVALLGEEFLHHLFSDPGTIRDLLEQIPEGRYWQTTMMRGFCYLADGNEADAGAILASVEAEVAATGGPSTPTQEVALAAFRLRLARHTNYTLDVDLTPARQRVLPAPAEGESLRLARAMSGALQGEYGLWLFHHHDFARARTVLHEALTLARFAGLDWLVVLVMSALSCVLAACGLHQESRRLVREAELSAAAVQPVGEWLLQLARLATALTELDAGDAVAAREALRLFRAPGPHRPEDDAFVAYLEASVLLLEGRPLDALALVLSTRQTPAPRTRLQQTVLATVAFHALCELDRLAEAEQELVGIRRVAPGRHDVLVEVLQARLLLRRDQPERAVASLQPHVDGIPDTDLLGALAALTTYTAAADRAGLEAEADLGRHRVRAITDQIGIDAHLGLQSVLAVRLANHDPQLSPAELNVLRQLRDDVPLSVVAERLFISQNTLKTHLRKIYRKLQVTGRDQAVERARLSGLF